MYSLPWLHQIPRHCHVLRGNGRWVLWMEVSKEQECQHHHCLLTLKSRIFPIYKLSQQRHSKVKMIFLTEACLFCLQPWRAALGLLGCTRIPFVVEFPWILEQYSRQSMQPATNALEGCNGQYQSIRRTNKEVFSSSIRQLGKKTGNNIFDLNKHKHRAFEANGKTSVQ